MARLEGAYEQVSQRLMNIDTRLDTLDRKVDLLRDALDAVRDGLDKKIDGFDAKSNQRFTWTVGIFITAWVTTIASIYVHH